MTNLHYTDPDLVALYDTLNGWGVDRDFYVALPGPGPIRILEVGCGTGLIARHLAALGHDVTGLDPALPMLEFAARAEGGQQVRWEQGVLADYDAPPFDLIFMTGHAFQCLLTDAEITAFFAGARRLLAAGGLLVFETRNPAVRAWEDWVPKKTKRTLALPDGQMVTEWHALDDVRDGVVDFQSIYEFGNRRLSSQSTLRFADVGTLTRLCLDAGLTVRQTFGDWDCSPFDHDSPEIILQIARE